MLDNGVKSRTKVRFKTSDDFAVDGTVGKLGKGSNLLRVSFSFWPFLLQKTDNVNLQSGNWVPSAWTEMLNASVAEVVNLHWVAG